LNEVVERLLSGRIREAIVLELADLTRSVGGERVEERLAHPRIVVVACGELVALFLQDPLERLADLLEGTGEVERGFLLLSTPAQTPADGIEAVESALHATTEQPLQGSVRRRSHQDVVGELVQHVGRRDVGAERILAAIPSGV